MKVTPVRGHASQGLLEKKHESEEADFPGLPQPNIVASLRSPSLSIRPTTASAQASVLVGTGRGWWVERGGERGGGGKGRETRQERDFYVCKVWHF